MSYCVNCGQETTYCKCANPQLNISESQLDRIEALLVKLVGLLEAK